jgi:hypothetical protein
MGFMSFILEAYVHMRNGDCGRDHGGRAFQGQDVIVKMSDRDPEVGRRTRILFGCLKRDFKII